MKIVNVVGTEMSFTKGILRFINTNKHFNIKFGNNGWDISYGISDSMYIEELKNENNSVNLTGGDYALIPIVRNNIEVKDKRGNNISFIGSSSNDGSYLCFINRPPNFRGDFKYILDGNCEIDSVATEYYDDIIIDLPVIVMKKNSEVKLQLNTCDRIITIYCNKNGILTAKEKE